MPRSPAAPTSPTRARSTSDLLSSDHEKLKNRELERERGKNTLNIAISDNTSSGSLHLGASMTNDGLSSVDEVVEERVEPRERDKYVNFSRLMAGPGQER